MALLTNTALTGIKNYIKRIVSHAEYKIGSTYYKVPLKDIIIDNAGVVRISFMIQPENSNATVSEVRLYNTSGQLWFSKAVSLKVAAVEEGFYYLVKLSITEVDE